MIYFLLYLGVINIITFSVWGVDKRKASKEKRRISEKNLLVLAAIWGWLGAAIGIQFFRHKTIKTQFAWKIRTLIVAWVFLSFIILYYFS